MPDLVPLPHYVYGTRVDQLDPPLAFLADDDWVTPLHKWIVEHYPDTTWWCVADGPGESAAMKAIWVGTPPDEVDDGDEVHVLRVGVKGA